MLVSSISSALSHGRDSPAKKRDSVEKKRDSVEEKKRDSVEKLRSSVVVSTSLLEPAPPNPFSLARDAIMQAKPAAFPAYLAPWVAHIGSVDVSISPHFSY